MNVNESLFEKSKCLQTSPGARSVWVISKGDPTQVEDPQQYCVQRWEILGEVAVPKDFCGASESLDFARTFAPRGCKPTPVKWDTYPYAVEVMIP